MTAGTAEYTFDGLLEHQTWHFQVYAVNEDATGHLGTGAASDSKSAKTDEGCCPPHRPVGVGEQVENDIRLYWEVPDDPAGAPVNRLPDPGTPDHRH